VQGGQGGHRSIMPGAAPAGPALLARSRLECEYRICFVSVTQREESKCRIKV
jgi:hypothetical protein